MITTMVYLPSVSTQSYIIFLVIRTFKICSLDDFQVCTTILLPAVTMLWITFPWLIYFIIRLKFLVGDLRERLILNVQYTRYISEEDKFNDDKQKQDFLCTWVK